MSSKFLFNFVSRRNINSILQLSLMNIISKFGTTSTQSHQQKGNEPPSPALSPTPKNQAGAPISWSNSGLAISGTMDTSTMGLSDAQLRRQGLECLVAVLRSLVVWGTAATGKLTDEVTVAPSSARTQVGDDARRDATIPERSLDKLPVHSGSLETLRQSTPDLADDPSKFESAKQKKTTLMEGIKKFNFKPKRVRLSVSSPFGKTLTGL